MPKKVDHEARRREIVEALWRITARGGLEAATIREVAAEAGCSVRPVQYYFRNKADLMAAAHTLVAQRMGERVTRAVQALGPDAAPRAIVEAVTRAFLPTDPEARECMQLFFAFYAVELTDAAMRIPDARGVPNALGTLIANQVRRAQATGDAPTDIDPDREAALLVLAIPNLTSGVIAGYLDLATATDLLDYAVGRLFSARPAGATPRARGRSSTGRARPA